MSLVTTARLYFGQSLWLRRSTKAVLPEPTGPAMPIRNAREGTELVIFLPWLSWLREPLANARYRRQSRVERARRTRQPNAGECGLGDKRGQARATDRHPKLQ